VPVGIEGACYPAAGADHYGSMLLVFLEVNGGIFVKKKKKKNTPQLCSV
jgi:hypothetical protein